MTFVKVHATVILDNILKDKRTLERPCITLIPLREIQYITEGSEGTIIETGHTTFVVTESIEEAQNLL